MISLIFYLKFNIFQLYFLSKSYMRITLQKQLRTFIVRKQDFLSKKNEKSLEFLNGEYRE